MPAMATSAQTRPGPVDGPDVTVGHAAPAEPPPPMVPEDWPKQATDGVVRVVDAVRDKTTGPVINVATVVVYGLVALTAASVLAVLLAIAAVRGLTLLLWDRAWAAHLSLGLLTTLGGFICWAKRPRLNRSRRD